MSQVIDVIKMLTEKIKTKNVEHFKETIKYAQIVILLKHYNKLKDIVFYKSKNGYNNPTSSSHVLISIDEFDELVKLGVLEVTSRMEDFVYGAVKDKEMLKLNDIVNIIKREVLDEEWKISARSPDGVIPGSSKEDVLVIDMYAFNIHIDFNENEDLLVLNRDYAISYYYFISNMFNFLYNTNKNEFDSKLKSSLNDNSKLKESILESMIDGRNLNKRFLLVIGNVYPNKFLPSSTGCISNDLISSSAKSVFNSFLCSHLGQLNDWM